MAALLCKGGRSRVWGCQSSDSGVLEPTGKTVGGSGFSRSSGWTAGYQRSGDEFIADKFLATDRPRLYRLG